jgi:ribose transport system substrate-binding protein
MSTLSTSRHKGVKFGAVTVALCLAGIGSTACSKDDVAAKKSGATTSSSASAGSTGSTTPSTSQAGATTPSVADATSPAAGTPAKAYTIGVAECITTVPFLATLDKAVIDEAAKLGSKAIVLNGKADAALEAANIDTLVTQKVDGILVISCHPAASEPAIKKARAAGIPVFAVNAKLAPSADVITYIGASDFDMGVKQGELVVKALPDGGKIAVILAPLGGVPQVQRLAGLNKVLKDHPNIEIVQQTTDNYENAKNLAITQDLLTKYPAGKLNAIVAQGPQMYVGAEYAMKQGRKDVVFIAADYHDKVEASIKSGALYGTVDQPPVMEGQLGAKHMISWLSGNQAGVPKPELLVETPLVTKENVAGYPATWKG